MRPRRAVPVEAIQAVDHAPSRGLPRDRTEVVTQLFDEHFVHLVRMARFLVDDTGTAEDVVMNAFTSLYRRWRPALRDPDEGYRYVRSCVLQRCADPVAATTGGSSALGRADRPRWGDDTRSDPMKRRWVPTA